MEKNASSFSRQALGALRILLFVVLLGFCYLMLRITLPYLKPPFPTDIEFLATKQNVIDIDYWRWAFYIHICSSFVVLVSGSVQFSKLMLRRYPRVHRNLGKLYVALILFVAAPSGLLMAIHANGGLAAQIAFVLQGILWWSFTLMAYRRIRQKDLQGHGQWMFRSYAMSLSAISLRLVSFMAGWLIFNINYEDLYVISAWTSWGFNLLVAEILIRAGVVKYYFK
jgi:uncharacterized membrane protein